MFSRFRITKNKCWILEDHFLVQGQCRFFFNLELISFLTTGCSKLTITRLMSQLRQTGSTSDRSRSGRPRETTLRQDRHIRLIHIRDRFVPATVAARQTQGRHNPRISAQTVRNRLKAAGLRSRRPVVGAVLTQHHRNARLRWNTARHYWTRRRWQNVIFSDESRFRLRRSDGRMRVYRRPNERYINACVHECGRFGGGSVMEWAGITHCICGRTDLKIVNGNLKAATPSNKTMPDATWQHMQPVSCTGTRIPNPTFSSFGPSRDYGMDLCLEVYLWAMYPYFTTFRVTTLSFCSKIYFQTKIHTIIAGGTKWRKSRGVRNSSACASNLVLSNPCYTDEYTCTTSLPQYI